MVEEIGYDPKIEKQIILDDIMKKKLTQEGKILLSIIMETPILTKNFISEAMREMGFSYKVIKESFKELKDIYKGIIC